MNANQVKLKVSNMVTSLALRHNLDVAGVAKQCKLPKAKVECLIDSKDTCLDLNALCKLCAAFNVRITVRTNTKMRTP